jgi:tRNA(fMet)-specific endonuclease VapC
MYIFDTDHLSLYGRNHPAILAKLRTTPAQLITTAINAEEQLRGRLAQIAEAKNGSSQTAAYQWLTETIKFLSAFQMLPYDTHAQSIYRVLKAQRIRVGTQDLRIASIVLAHNGVLLTRNIRDFERVPGLVIQDWSIELP